MSEVTHSSEIEQNSVLAQNDTAAAEVAPVEVKAAKVAAKPSPKKVEEASAISIPVTNNSAKEKASSSSAADAKAVDDDVAAVTTDKSAAEETAAVVSPKVENKKTPAKRTPSKRMSFIERAQKESEELVKNLGGSLELEGGRRTRSSTRGTPTRSSVVATPPPAKKARSSPAASGSKETATTPSRRVRGRKIDVSAEPEPEPAESDGAATKEENKKPETEEGEQQPQATAAAADDNNDSEKSSVENAENSVVDAANSAAAAEEAEEIAKNAKKQVEEKSIAAVVGKVEDKTDAPLEPIPEEKQNNVDHNLKETEEKGTSEEPLTTSVKEPINKVTPQESVKEVIAESQIKATAENANIKKLPTPEPMEVDSSNSKDDGDVVELMEEDIIESVADTASLNTTAADTNLVVAQEEKDASTEPAVVDTNSVKTVIVNDLKAVAAPEIVDVSASGEPQATQASQAKNEHNKSENDFSEPKIVSPPTTDGTVTATPQYCN